MATEEEKKRNLARINAMIVFGLEKGLWDLLGESALAVTRSVGRGMLEKLEKTMGLEIAGEEPRDILMEVGRIFVDEFGIATQFDAVQEGGEANFEVHNCVLLKVEEDLINEGIKPFMCPYLNIAAAAMEKRLGKKARIVDISVDCKTRHCHLCFELI